MNILGMLSGGGAKDLVEGVGGVIDNLHTSKEEKLEAEQKIKEIVASYQATLESVDEGGFWTVVWDDGDTNDTTGHPKTDITEIISIPEPEPVTISHFCFCFYNSIWLHSEECFLY